MRLSTLQKYILLQCYLENKRLNRNKLVDFYGKQKKKPKVDDQVSIITKSIDRLIEKGLLIGYGSKTAEKLFIKEIKLTRLGRKIIREGFGQQQKLKI